MYLNQLPGNHPVRFLINSAVNGRKLTEKDLQILDKADLPPGQSLASYKAAVNSAAEKVAEVGSAGRRAEAERLGEQACNRIAGRMTAEQRAIDTTDPEPESLSALGAKYFDN